jgi:hypothetical protein
MNKRFCERFFSVLLLCLFLMTPESQAATGCTYKSGSHDTWSDRVAGDYLTTALLNQITCGVEGLMSGPLRPLDGSVGSPSFSWRDDSNTGLYRSGANEFVISTDGVQRGKWSNTGLLVGQSGTARGVLNAQKGGGWLVFNTHTIAAGASINLEHATNGVGSSDGMLFVYAQSGAGNGCIFTAGGGANVSAVISGSFGICQITDTGTGTIALIPDGDGTYTLKSRLATDQIFHMAWLGG